MICEGQMLLRLVWPPVLVSRNGRRSPVRIKYRALGLCGECGQEHTGARYRCGACLDYRRARDKWRAQPDLLMVRDGSKCGVCHEPVRLHADKWHLDHVVPHSLGGDPGPANMQIVHASCNGRKGATL